jgi:hypothetical protein
MDPSFVVASFVQLTSTAQRSDLRVQAARAFTDESMLADDTVTPLAGFVRLLKHNFHHWAIFLKGGKLHAAPLSAVMARDGEVTEKTQRELMRSARAAGLYTEGANAPLQFHA